MGKEGVIERADGGDGASAASRGQPSADVQRAARTRRLQRRADRACWVRVAVPVSMLLASLTPRLVHPQPGSPTAASSASASVAVPSAASESGSASAPPPVASAPAPASVVPGPVPPATIATAPAAPSAAPSAGPAAKAARRAPPPAILVMVQGSRPSRYQARHADFGPLGRMKLIEAPFSVHVVPADLFVDHEIRAPEDMVRFLPSAQIEARGGTEWGRPQTRGFQAEVADNTRIEGFHAMAPTAQPIEMYDRMEVLYGPTAALYGLGSPAGQFNAVLKRPTDKPLRRIWLGYQSDAAFVLHTDLGGRTGPDEAIGYRANLVMNDGDRYVDHASMRRQLASLVLDARLARRTLVEGVLSGYLLDQRGYPGGFTYGAKGSTRLPEAPDPTRVGFGQKFAGTLGKTGFFALRVRQGLGKDWELIGGASHQLTARRFHSLSNSFTDDVGGYNAAVRESADHQDLTSHQLYLQGHFTTGEVAHDVQLGANGRYMRGFAGQKSAQFALGSATLDTPQTWDEPSWRGTGPSYKASQALAQSFVLGYTATLLRRVALTAVGSLNWIHVENFANPAPSSAPGSPGAGAGTNSTYDAKAVVAPSAALSYRPVEGTLVYVNYGLGIQQGPTAPATAANANETLAPYRSSQAEAGFKAQSSRLTFTTAVFRIERPFAYVDPDDRVFRTQGQQVNYGAEVGLFGRVARDLVVFGGVSLLNPHLKDTGNPATSDKLVVGVPRWRQNLVVDWELPFVRNFVTSFTLHHTGMRAANDTNTTFAQEYTTADAAVRYGFPVRGAWFTTRLAVRNVLNEHYWISIMPGSINGDSGSYTAFLGAPRTFEASVRYDL